MTDASIRGAQGKTRETGIMKSVLPVPVVAAMIVWTGYWFGGVAAHAHEAAHGAAASQYGTEAGRPIPVGAAVSLTGSASASASAPSDASASAAAVVLPPEETPGADEEAASSASASVHSSASPAPTEPIGETSADPADPPACGDESCEGDAPVANDMSGRSRDPRSYPGFDYYERSTDEYVYQIDCMIDCGVQAEHPSNFDCQRNIRRKFDESGKVHRQKTTVTCVHPRFDDWESEKAVMPERWKGERCVYFYDEEGRPQPGGLDCDFGSGGDGIADSADDATEVDDEVSLVDPHSSTDGEREVVVGSAFWRVFRALVFGEAGRQERSEAPEDGDAERQVEASTPVGPPARQERKKESAASPITGGSEAAERVASPPVGSTPTHRPRTALRDDARVLYVKEGRAEGGDGSHVTAGTASLLAERLLARSSVEGPSDSGVGSAQSADDASDSARQETIEGGGKGKAVHGVEGPTRETSKVSGPSSEDGSGDQRIRTVSSDSPTWRRSHLLLLAGAFFLGTTIFVRRRR